MILNSEKLDSLIKDKSNITEGFIYNTVTINNYTPKRKRLKGKEMIVVPTTMIVEGVLNGIYYGKEEMAISTDSWNGMPVILNHPADGMSANRTEIIENYGLGTLYNTVFEINDKEQGVLNSEVWFDPEELERIDSELATRVNNGGVVEVSTGLRLNLQFVEASYNEVSFNFVSSNYKPDHLAILPNNIGACSCSDGCGLRQNSEDTLSVEISENVEYDIKENKKENIMANCNCPEKVATLTALIPVSEETALSFNEAQLDALIEAIPVEKVKEEVKEETGEGNEPVNTETPVEGDGASEEPVPTDTEVTAEEITANSEEGETIEEPTTEAEKIEEPKEEEPKEVVDTIEGLSEVVTENFRKQIEEAFALVANTKQELATGVMTNANNMFTKEELELKSIKELTALNALANSVTDYSLGAGSIAQNKANEENKVKPLQVPKY